MASSDAAESRRIEMDFSEHVAAHHIGTREAPIMQPASMWLWRGIKRVPTRWLGSSCLKAEPQSRFPFDAQR